MKQTSLEALLHPYEVIDFLESFKKNEPFVVHHEEDFPKSILDLPFLSSLDSLLNSWPFPIQAHLPDVRDEVSSIDTTVKDAQKLFDNGMGLLFNEAQKISPVLVHWLEDIRRTLGLSAITYGRSLIYATPDGKGTAPHFDQNINFVFQIKGIKKWKLAPNHSVQNPMTRHTMGQATDPELMSYLESSMPTEMPSDASSFELRPGSFLFVPRGFWHSTEAEGDALALNFTFTAPTWIDLLSAALRGRLALMPEWRETAVMGEENKFQYLLEGLAEELPHWKADEILEMTELNDMA
jgi:50S ribosomal protein L16 3-hydroxylase